MPNGTYGGVRGRKITVVKKYYVIFLLLDYASARIKICAVITLRNIVSG